MGDLISRSALIERMKRSWDMQEVYLPVHLIDFLEDEETVDAVPVVRCKDCIHWGNKIKHGSFLDVKQCDFHGTRRADAYCSDGEKVQE